MKKNLIVLLLSTFLLVGCSHEQHEESPSSSIEENKPTITLSSHNETIIAGHKLQLSASVDNIEEPYSILWQGFNNRVYVDNNGLVTGLTLGKDTVITGIDLNNDGELNPNEPMDYCDIEVVKEPSGVTLSFSKGYVEVSADHSVSLSVNIDPAPESGNYFYLSFSSADSSIASVYKESNYNTNLTIRGNSIGETDITASYAHKEASIRVKTIPWVEDGFTHVAGLSLEKKEILLEKDSSLSPTYQINPIFAPAEATNKNVNYYSNNEDVATVSATGLVTARNGGSALITVESEDLHKTAQLNVVVKDTSQTYENNYYDGYYAELTTWENGEDLINKLHNIIKDDTPLKYDWDVIKDADEAIDDALALETMYSNVNVLKSEQASAYSREHAFPASLMTGFSTGDATAQKGRATDYHNLFAASASGNSSRSNKNYGTADKNDGNYTITDNGAYSFDRLNFEPNDKDKGKASRAIFYMATMYNETETANVTDAITFNEADKATYGQNSKTVHIIYEQKPLEVREEYADYGKVSFTKFHYHEDEESQSLYNKYVGNVPEGLSLEELLEIETEAYGCYSTDNCEFAIGGLSDLLAWSSTSVTYAEMYRNNAVLAAQGNRNPFTDYPELINYAFGALKDEPGNLANIRPSEDILKMADKEIVGYKAVSYAQSAVVGATYDINDVTLKAVRSDLSLVDAISSDIEYTPYTFTNSDLNAGFAYVPIQTKFNTINLKIKVTSEDINICNYIYRLVGKSKQDWGNADLAGFSNGDTATFGALDWVISWTNAEASVEKTFAKAGVAFGTGAKSVGTITFETVDSLTNVQAFFALVNAASNQKPSYTMYIGSTLVKSGSYTGAGNTAYPVMIGAKCNNLSGKAKIVISGATNFAIYMHTLALKY